MRRRRYTDDPPPELPLAVPPDPVDRDRPLPVPDEERMQVALHRALRYHLQRIHDTEGIDYTGYHGELDIISLPRMFPVEVAPGWWNIGTVSDARSGLTWRMEVLWEPATDRVRIDRIPDPPPPLPEPELRPITVDANYRIQVADGWRYWHAGRAYTAEEARAVLCLPGVHAYEGWSWERIADGDSTGTT